MNDNAVFCLIICSLILCFSSCCMVDDFNRTKVKIEKMRLDNPQAEKE